MKTTHCLLLMAFALPLAAQTTPPSKSAPAKPTAARPADPAPATPPASAQQIDSATFHWKDAKGDLWIYKKTPFGWSKMREKELASYQRPDQKQPPIEVREVRGDEVTFEKPTPFGPIRWTKQKDALSADERAALDRWSARASEPARTATAGKE
jgi:hypothetical protein